MSDTDAELDIELELQLTRYLQTSGWLAPEESLRRFRVLAGGVSNKTVLAGIPGDGDWVIKQCLSRLRVRVDWFTSPERIHREAEALRVLPALLGEDVTPRLIFEDRSHHILAMTAVPQPHENWKQRLLAGHLQPDHVRQFGHILASLHSRSAERIAEYEPAFADRRFYESLRLEAYYQFAGQTTPESAPFYARLIDETRAQHRSLVHGDYSPKNVLIREGRLILLDHEVMHIGDPAFDIGFAMTHLLSKAHHLPALRQQFLEAAASFWNTYLQDSSPQISASEGFAGRAARHIAACLLARVDGRSPLEYLSTAERDRQRAMALSLMRSQPSDPHGLITAVATVLGEN
jgi:aminoglycoside phosphotransferase (APT) family kinase protein